MHISKFLFYDILAIAFFVVSNMIIIRIVNDYKENKLLKNDFSNYNLTIEEAYRIDPSLFNFDEDGIAIIKIDDLLKPITNGKDTIYFGVVPLTKEQDQCVGYIIVKKKKDDLDIDTSHMCDIIDY